MTGLVVTSVIEVRDDRTGGDLCYRSKSIVELIPNASHTQLIQYFSRTCVSDNIA